MTDPTPDVVDVESRVEHGTLVIDAPAVRQPQAVASPTTPTAEWNVIVAQAEVLARSGIIPKAYTGKPENIIAAAITGRQFGWDVMAAMRNTHVIEGSVAIKPEAQVGLVRAAGHSISGSSSSTEATVTGTRVDTGDTMTVTWTIDDAKAANLTGKAVWKQYPSDMLWARAVSQLCRRLFPDVTLGLSYTPDELERADAAAPDFSGDIADPAAEAAVPDPPEGWESWDACTEAHDALKAAVAAADPQARNQWQGYLRDSGYKPWFTKAQHDELAAQLDVLVGAPTERVATTIPEAEVVETPAPTTADNGDQDGAAPTLLDGTAVPDPEVRSGPSGESGEAPDPAPTDVPAPGGAPIEMLTRNQRNQIGALCGTSGMNLERDVRLAILGFCAQREVGSMNDLTKNEASWGIAALKLMAKGALEWDADAGVLVIRDQTDGMTEHPERLPGAVFLRDFAEAHGLEFAIHPTD